MRISAFSFIIILVSPLERQNSTSVCWGRADVRDHRVAVLRPVSGTNKPFFLRHVCSSVVHFCHQCRDPTLVDNYEVHCG